MSRTKKILVLVGTIIGLLFLISIWYQQTYAMDVAESFEVNSPEYSQKLLIATQGSEFKGKLTTTIIDHFKEDSIYIKVVDISELKAIEPTSYSALVLIHTWENWKPPKSIETFVERTKPYSERIVVITTSGEGSRKMDDVDAITGESKPENSLVMVKQALSKLEIILKSH
ncbi:hypothetical protein [Psychroserpens luteolus]|uniref:hypothetical protein n=1 Tax=Psychroserpens luteolus TaxID=2855840 RepID=UPI001E4DA81B|nr:hypothetical protein [Psychroserpens luteolus]MCD2259609.1 hypothetical protein [Psychroserpens luteolus]